MVAALAASPAAAKPVTGDFGDGVMVDWSRGTMNAPGAAPGDLRAPTPAMARTKAQRLARQRARARLGEAALRLPVFGDGALGEHLGGRRDGLEASLAQSTVSSETLGSDGSAVVSVTLGLDGLRTLLGGPTQPVKAQAPGKGAPKSEVDSLVIDARGIALGPALGVAVVADDARYRGPVLFFTSRREALADARVGKHRDAKAVALTADAVRIEGLAAAELTALAEGAPVIAFVIQAPRAKGKRR